MKALITGITGQDGSYLAEFLLDKGYEVYGLVRRSSSFNTGRIDHIIDRIKFFYSDLTDGSSLSRIVGEVKPDESITSALKAMFALASTRLSTPQMWTVLARCAFSKQSRRNARPLSSIKRHQANCMARCWRHRRPKQRRSILEARTG